MTATDYERRYTIQRTAKAIDYHSEALGLIPEYEANASLRAVHAKALEEALEKMRELLA